MDLGEPSSYQVLSAGTPVYSSDGEQIGKVAHVLAVQSEDVFDGIVIGEHIFGQDHRFADAEDVDRISSIAGSTGANPIVMSAQRHDEVVAAEPYQFGGGLWSMVYLQGKARSCASR